MKKKVLVMVLSAVLASAALSGCTEQELPVAAEVGTTDSVTQTDVQSEETGSSYVSYGIDWEKNPIDTVESRFCMDNLCNRDRCAFKCAVADAWEAEVRNAYRLLEKSANPNYEHLPQEVSDTLDAFLRYAEKTSQTEAQVYFSSMFISEEADPDDIFAGTALGGAAQQIKGEILRDEALRIYGLLEFIHDYSSAEEVFVFDQDYFVDQLRDYYEVDVDSALLIEE